MRELAYPPKQKNEYEFYGEVIEEVMYEIVKHTDSDLILTEQLIDLVAKSLDLSVEEIIEYLHECKSDFVANNEICGFILNEKGKMEYIKRITIFANVKKTFIEKFKPNFANLDEMKWALQKYTHENRVGNAKFNWS